MNMAVETAWFVNNPLLSSASRAANNFCKKESASVGRVLCYIKIIRGYYVLVGMRGYFVPIASSHCVLVGRSEGGLVCFELFVEPSSPFSESTLGARTVGGN